MIHHSFIAKNFRRVAKKVTLFMNLIIIFFYYTTPIQLTFMSKLNLPFKYFLRKFINTSIKPSNYNITKKLVISFKNY